MYKSQHVINLNILMTKQYIYLDKMFLTLYITFQEIILEITLV